MMRYFFLFLPSCLLAQPDMQKPFDDCELIGSITIYDLKNQQWIRSNATDSDIATLPASTFKIINTLIALETGVIDDEHVVVPWPGETDTTLYGYRPDIYHDMTVKKAFEVSAGWVYIELAKKIGKERYRQLMEASGYGNGDLSQPADDFWNYGGFGVTPNEQVQLLIDLYEGKLPFLGRNMEIVKRVMIAESTPDYVLHAKTGWTRDNGKDTGWWVGYVERGDNVYFFATRAIKDRSVHNSNFGRCRIEITKSILREMGAI